MLLSARASIGLALALALPACTFKVGVGAADVDRVLDEMGAETVVRTEAFTLWSPYSRFATPDWVTAVAEERAAVLDCLGGEAAAIRLQVRLEPVAGLAPTFELAADGSIVVDKRPEPARFRLDGWADRDLVVVRVPAAQVLQRKEGGPITSHAKPDGYRRTLRHELAHWRAHALSIDGDSWLTEGLAQLLEGLEFEDGRLVDRGPPAGDLAPARALHVEDMPLCELLDWREDGKHVVDAARRGIDGLELGVEPAPRTACGLYVRFLLDLCGDGEPVEDLGARLHALGRLARAEHLAGEARWRAWLTHALERDASTTTAR